MALEDNKAKINVLLAAINALPEAGASGDSGLPTGVSALATGSVTIVQDETYETITHDLGSIPNFVAWIIEDEITTEVLTSAAICGASLAKSTDASIVHYLVRGYGTTGSAAGTTGSTSSTVYMTTTQARMVAHNSYKLIAGKTYRWVCGVMDGVL